MAAQGLGFSQSSRLVVPVCSMPFEGACPCPLLSEAKENIYFHHHPHSSLAATKAEFWSNSLKHQLEGWAPSTGNTQGEERVFFVRHEYSSCSLAVSLAGRRERTCSRGCIACLSLLYPAGLSRKHSVLVRQSVSILNQQGVVCVCTCPRVCAGRRVVEEEEGALGRWLRAPAGALPSLADTMK